VACASLENEKVISFTNRIFELVSENENIQSEKVIFENEKHGSAWPAINTRALNYFYKNEFAILISDGGKLYYEKNYYGAIEKYSQAFELYPEQINSRKRYSLACFYALANDKEEAFLQLEIVADHKYSYYDHIIQDEDLNSLHTDKRWKVIITKIKANYEQKSRDQ